MTKVIVAVQRSPTDERAIDAELADSFPASDPPSWTTGIAETRPRGKPRVDPQVAHIEESTGAAGCSNRSSRWQESSSWCGRFRSMSWRCR